MRPTVAEIVLPALRHNVSLLRSRLESAGGDGAFGPGGGGPEIIGVVKADAYGHGATGISRELVKLGIKWLAVAGLEEAEELAAARIPARLIILGPLSAAEMKDALGSGHIPVLSSPADLQVISSLEKNGELSLKKPADFILDLDTGMGRMGFLPEQAAEAVDFLRGRPWLRLIGLFSHLAAAESGDEEDLAYTRRQVEDFRLMTAAVKKFFPDLRLVSLANSAGVFFHPDSFLSAVRPGISLYGVRPAAELSEPAQLRPVLRWVTRIVQVRELPAGASVSYGRKTVLKRPSRLGLLPVGYADGLRRNLPPGFPLLRAGRPVPIAGVVTMDFTLIDVTDFPEAGVGDRVLIMGRESEQELRRNPAAGGEALPEIRAEDHARAAGTIPYEILTGIGKRVPRVYKEE